MRKINTVENVTITPKKACSCGEVHAHVMVGRYLGENRFLYLECHACLSTLIGKARALVHRTRYP